MCELAGLSKTRAMEAWAPLLIPRQATVGSTRTNICTVKGKSLSISREQLSKGDISPTFATGHAISSK